MDLEARVLQAPCRLENSRRQPGCQSRCTQGMSTLSMGWSRNETPGSPWLLDLRPAPRGSSRAVAPRKPSQALGTDGAARVELEVVDEPGSWRMLLRQAGRLAKASL